MIRKFYINSSVFAGYLIPALLFLQINILLPETIHAADQINCGDRLDQAEENYYNGDFDKAVIMINKCLQDNTLSATERIRGYKLLAKIYLSRNEISKAKKNIHHILSLDPNYQPTIEEERPNYVELVNQARGEQEQMAVNKADSGISSWVWIGAGGAAAVAIIAIVASGSSGNGNNSQNQTLPNPPDFPD